MALCVSILLQMNIESDLISVAQKKSVTVSVTVTGYIPTAQICLLTIQIVFPTALHSNLC